MESISAKKARDQLSDLLNKVAYAGEKFTLTRHGQGVAVLISLKEWQKIAQLLEKLEDEQDLQDADLSYSKYLEEGGVSFSDAKKELGLE